MEERARLLLHSCCGPCSTACIERLAASYDVTLFYSNSNITDREEYEKRKENQLIVIRAFNDLLPADRRPIDFIEGEYRPEEFLSRVKGLENEPEGGLRCPVCFRMRLEDTAAMAVVLGIPYFTTTLPVSPHKNFAQISAIGEEVASAFGVTFLAFDFKKKDGFKRSIELSKEFGLYRQNYCGCDFSRH